MIHLVRPFFDDAESEALVRVLASGMLVQGECVRAFENAVARRLDPSAPPEAVAVSNGTTALELALAVLNVGPGDEVLVPAVTWPSPANAIVLRGAVPVLVDVDPRTFNIHPAAVPALLTPRTRAVIAIDQFGVPAPLGLLRRHAADVPLLEDAACALGSALEGVSCGLLGTLGTFSFHPRKVLTTGEGGMVVTRDKALAERLRVLRNHGLCAPARFAEAGTNARLTELQGALGVAQMGKLETVLARRSALALKMRGALELHWQGAPEGALVNHQTLSFVLPAPEKGTRAEARDKLVAALRTDGIEASFLSYALHRLPQFASFAVNVTRRFPVADAVVDGGLALPLHPLMTEADAQTIVDAVSRHAAWALGKPAF